MEIITEVVGEIEAGEAAKVRKQVSALIKSLNVNTFDLAEALFKVKINHFYQPKYDTFGEYVKSLVANGELKETKIYYLARIAENMATLNIPREVYEPLGIAKLRVISRLDPLEDAPDGTPMANHIKGLVESAALMSPNDIKMAVAVLKGEVGPEAFDWVNFSIKHSAKEIWDQAVALAKKNIGSVGQDESGNFKDAGEGAAAEVIAVNYLQDPNNGGL